MNARRGERTNDMIEMTARTLMESIYDGDMNETTLIFEDRDTKAIATGRVPEGSKDDEFYFDNEENIKTFLETAEIKEV